MAAFVNTVIVAGNLTRDVEIRYTPGGTAVADISVAVNERRKQGDDWIEEVTFVDVTLWGRTAEVAGEYLQKGAPVLIEGKLRLDSWETESGKRSKLKVVCNRLQMLGNKPDGAGSRGGKKAPPRDEPPPAEIPGDDIPPDDIPF